MYRFSAHRSPERGLTMLEIMIVLAIIGGMMAMFMGSMFTSDETRLRQDASTVMAALRSARHLSMSTGRQHRVVFDLEEQKYQIDVCDSLVLQTRTDEEEVVDRDKLAELMEKDVSSDFNQEILEAESPEKALEAAAALEGIRVGAARCTQQLSRGSGHSRSQKTDFKIEAKEEGIRIARVDVQHLTEPVTETTVSVNFFPIGSAEKAVLRLENNDGDVFSILVHGVTGRIEMRSGEVKPEKHMLRDGAGKDVEEREET